MKKRRVFLIVLDSLGIGALPDAYLYGDEGSNTLKSLTTDENFKLNTLLKLGLGNIDGVDYLPSVNNPIGSFARLQESSKGKDTTIGHWEIAGIISETPFPVYPNGFPQDIIEEFEKRINRKILYNRPASGTEIIEKLGSEHVKTGSPIVYTSADSVFQIAAHEDVIPIETLYDYCKIAREILQGENAVARVIARPFKGQEGHYRRTANRKDFSVAPPSATLIDILNKNHYKVTGAGKIGDIFANRGLSISYHTKNNDEGMEYLMKSLYDQYEGLVFANLVDFDMLYGHRNDVYGYSKALMRFDGWLKKFICNMSQDDILMITGDHGCDPSTPSTDHSREYTPLIIYGNNIKQGVNLGIRATFADIAATICQYFNIYFNTKGVSFLNQILI